MQATPLNIEGAIDERYSQASQKTEASLCCPVDYEARWLEVLPDELIERDLDVQWRAVPLPGVTGEELVS